MSGKLFTPSQNSHWYYSDKTPCHQVPNKSKPGELRPTTLTDARKLGLLPSVTSICKLLVKPQLESWKQEQAVLAALTLPRVAGEDDQTFAKRVVEDAESIALNAAQKGTKIHNAIERYLMTGEKCVDEEVAHLVEPFYDWSNANILDVKLCEAVLISPDGYAGRLDLKADFAGLGIKYADFKSRKPTKGKIISYVDDGFQLSGYRRADQGFEFGCLSLLINSEEPSIPFVKEWTQEELIIGEEVFMHLFEIWKLVKNYTPTVK